MSDLIPETVPYEHRSIVMRRLAGLLRRAGMTRDEIFTSLDAVNLSRFEDALPIDYVKRVSEWICSKEPDQITETYVNADFEKFTRVVRGPVTARRLIEDNSSLRKPVIDGILRQGETMNIIAGPKVGKSWLVTGLALDVVRGGRWMDLHKCSQGRVLIVDNELHPETTAHRIPIVAESHGMAVDDYGDLLHILSLRGNLMTMDRMFDDILKQAKKGFYKIVILDAFYRFMPSGISENDNAQIARLYNDIDRMASETGASFVLVHHSSKGDQSQKSVTDVGSGAGSQSRAADVHMVIRRHKESGAFVIDAAVRSWSPLDPICARWEFPRFIRDYDLDPNCLHSNDDGGDDQVSADDVADYVSQVAVKPMSMVEIIDIGKQLGFSEKRSRKMIREAVSLGILRKKNGKLTTEG